MQLVGEDDMFIWIGREDFQKVVGGGNVCPDLATL